MRTRLLLVGIGALLGLGAGSGCTQIQPGTPQAEQLHKRALDCLKRGITYEPLPTVRVQAIEAWQDLVASGTPAGVHEAEALPWIRQALLDEQPAVRFAACLALGNLRDQVARPALARLLDSAQDSDRIAAIFALHHLGDSAHVADLAAYLLDNSDPTTRRHAAMALGRLGEKGAVKLLARVMTDADAGLRAEALESMCLLGADEARATVYANAFGGIGAEEAFALNTLAALRSPDMEKLFRQKLRSGLHHETRLAAARGLGMLGHRDGLRTARAALSYRATRDEQGDPAANQTLRIRQMAALALGTIGDPAALVDLSRMLNEGDDPRLQIAAAKAILEILQAAEHSGNVTAGLHSGPRS